MTASRFQVVWIPLQDRFYRVAFHLLEDRADAEDAVQDLYLKLWGIRDLLDLVENPVAYGILLTRNLCIDRIRKRRRTEPTDESLPGDAPPDDGVIAKELLRDAARLIDELPPGQRRVLRMRVFEGKANPEIAAETGISELSVRVQVSMARSKIKRRLKDEKHR